MTARARVRLLVSDHRWPIMACAVYVLAAALFTFEWLAVCFHTDRWAVPDDVWQTWRAAHYVGWGDISDVYGAQTRLVTYPGIAVALAPLAMLSDKLRLTESIYPYFVAKPRAWLLLGPATVLSGATTLFAADRFGRLLGATQHRRAALALAAVVPVFLMTALWGHPEDCLALTFALYAIVDLWNGELRRSGWLWGLAVVFQPLVLLLLPVAIARTRRGERVATCVRAALPTAALVAIPVATSWSATSEALFRQPNYPALNHATPLMAIATRLSPTTVSAGPGRLVALAAAVGLGLLAYRFRPGVGGFAWLCALALVLRCVCESVVDPFYLGPACLLVFCAALSRARPWPAVGALASGCGAIVCSYMHWTEWPYWLAMTSLLGVSLACAWPGRAAFSDGPDPDATAGGAAAHDTGVRVGSEVDGVPGPLLDDVDVVGPRTGGQVLPPGVG